MADNIFLKKITSIQEPKVLDQGQNHCSLLSTYTSKGPQPHPPGPDGTKCFCIECAEWKFGPRIPNGIPKANSWFAGYTCNWCPNAARPDQNMHSFGGFDDTERCKICSREIKSWQRANELADELIIFSENRGLRMRFITLTLPNYSEALPGMADLEKESQKFSPNRHLPKEGRRRS